MIPKPPFAPLNIVSMARSVWADLPVGGDVVQDGRG